MSWLNVPHIKQAEPSWCLPACVAMVTAYLQQPLLQDDVACWLDTKEAGTPASRVQRLTRRGFEVTYNDAGSLADLEAWLKR